MNEVYSKTHQAVKKTAEDLNLSPEIVGQVVNHFVYLMTQCVLAEVPFHLRQFGKFYHTYHSVNEWNKKLSPNPEFFEGKILRKLAFKPDYTISERSTGWVDDLGLKNNLDKKDLLRLAIKPEEIQRIRRAKLLEEQRAHGFRTELLFDEHEMDEHDKDVLDELEDAPSMRDMMRRLGVEL